MSRRGFSNEAKENLFTAIRNNDLSRIEEIFERNRVPQNILDECLSRTGSLDILNFFLEAGARDTENNALFNACCIGDIEMIDKLVDTFHPDTNTLSETLEGIIENTFSDCTNTNAVIRKLVQEGANVNYNQGKILNAACERNNLQAVNLLLELGANPSLENEDDDDSGYLYHAALNHNPQMVSRLFEAGALVYPVMNSVIADMIEDLNDDIIPDIIATIQELIRHDIKPNSNDIRAILREQNNISPQNLELLLNTVLIENISLSQANMSRLQYLQENEHITLNLQNAVIRNEDESDNESEDEHNERHNQSIVERKAAEQNSDSEFEDESESDSEEYTQRNSAENRARALQIERENEAKRQAAIEEYKTEEYKTTEMEAQPIEVKVNAYCYPTSHSTLTGDTLQDTDDFVIFLVEGSEKGDCYLRSELQEIYRQEPVAFEFLGAPFGVSIDRSVRNMSRGPDDDKPVYKLPWTNIWITKQALAQAISSRPRTRSYTPPNVIILRGEKQSIGSDFGNMTGQFGGHWARDNGRAIYVESGDSQPDNRPIVYRYVRSEII